MRIISKYFLILILCYSSNTERMVCYAFHHITYPRDVGSDLSFTHRWGNHKVAKNPVISTTTTTTTTKSYHGRYHIISAKKNRQRPASTKTALYFMGSDGGILGIGGPEIVSKDGSILVALPSNFFAVNCLCNVSSFLLDIY
jgi:hypothetical protein